MGEEDGGGDDDSVRCFGRATMSSSSFSCPGMRLMTKNGRGNVDVDVAKMMKYLT